MSSSSLLDLAPITRFLRAKASSHLLVAAIHHLNVFEELDTSPQSVAGLSQKLQLKERPSMVLFPALCAMGMLRFNESGKLELTELGRFLIKSNPDNIIGYAGLEMEDPGVIRLTEWLKHDGPADPSKGVSYIKDDDAPSPMDEPGSARFFTLALAGRARYLSPLVADRMSRRKGHLLDIAGGTGYYTFEWLLANPDSTATLFDREEVLKVAKELLDDFCKEDFAHRSDIKNRIRFQPGDMLTDDLPQADVVLTASLFHDWPTETCIFFAQKFAAALKPGGELWVHDAFLNDSLDGPVAVTDYSTLLFLGTKGRCYSRKEYRGWLSAAGLIPSPEHIPTLMDYGLISAGKPL